MHEGVLVGAVVVLEQLAKFAWVGIYLTVRVAELVVGHHLLLGELRLSVQRRTKSLRNRVPNEGDPELTLRQRDHLEVVHFAINVLLIAILLEEHLALVLTPITQWHLHLRQVQLCQRLIVIIDTF